MITVGGADDLDDFLDEEEYEEEYEDDELSDEEREFEEMFEEGDLDDLLDEHEATSNQCSPAMEWRLSEDGGAPSNVTDFPRFSSVCSLPVEWSLKLEL